MGDSPNPFAQTYLLLPDSPPGTILLWSGAVVDIPARWHLCDGTNGTPDLVNKFVVGAGLTFAVGDKRSTTHHPHDFTGDGHFHALDTTTGLTAGIDFQAKTDTDPITGDTDTEASIAPFYTLAYIMAGD